MSKVLFCILLIKAGRSAHLRDSDGGVACEGANLDCPSCLNTLHQQAHELTLLRTDLQEPPSKMLSLL